VEFDAQLGDNVVTVATTVVPVGWVFGDGFETGNTTRWSGTAP
jgi:hypothetical protein